MTSFSSLPRALRSITLGSLLAVAALTLATAPQAALSAAPQQRTQAPGWYRVMLGDFEVTALSDGTLDLDVATLLNEPKEKTSAALKASFEASPLETSVNAYLINTGTKLVLIDGGAGTLFGPGAGRLMANLRAAGYQPEQVDDILVTHMHPDHVGGLASGGAIVFPNAVVHADKRDADFWLSQANLDKAPDGSKGFFRGAMSSLDPYVKAGKVDFFESAGERIAGIRSVSSPGHTPGHTSYVVESRGHELVVAGDLIHVAAVQFADPGVTIAFDNDGRQAAVARRKVFAQAAKDGALVAAAHLPFPGLGHLRAAGAAWQWLPSDYTNELK